MKSERLEDIETANSDHQNFRENANDDRQYGIGISKPEDGVRSFGGQGGVGGTKEETGLKRGDGASIGQDQERRSARSSSSDGSVGSSGGSDEDQQCGRQRLAQISAGRTRRNFRDRVSEYEARYRRESAKEKGKEKGVEGTAALANGSESDRGRYMTLAGLPSEILGHIFSFLDPGSLSMLSLVSKKLNAVVNGTEVIHRSAFAKHFPGQEVPGDSSPRSRGLRPQDCELFASYRQETRYFSRLNVNSSWRKEYLYRSILLRALTMGKPNPTAASLRKNKYATAVGGLITYFGLPRGNIITHLAVTFPAVDHAAEMGTAALRPHVTSASSSRTVASTSDPTTGTLDNGTRHSPHRFTLSTPSSNIPAHLPGYQLGDCVMDLSDELGLVAGETAPMGGVYVLPKDMPSRGPEPGGYFVKEGENWSHHQANTYISAVWIAKKKAGGILETTNQKCGIITANSSGRIAVYSIPTTPKAARSDPDRWATPVKSWVVCPGVPIVGIKVDEDYSVKRRRMYRKATEGLMVVVVNALGEVYYLWDLDAEWRIIEPTRRIIHPEIDPTRLKRFDTEKKLLAMDWTEAQRLWAGWGMDYFIETDFAEANIVLGKAGKAKRKPKRDIFGVQAHDSEPHILGPQTKGWMKRLKLQRSGDGNPCRRYRGTAEQPLGSVFGPSILTEHVHDAYVAEFEYIGVDNRMSNIEALPEKAQDCEEGKSDWLAIDLAFPLHEQVEITAFAMDMSHTAQLFPGEDPLLQDSVPGSRPENTVPRREVPGQRGRLFAVGTDEGDVLVWNIRATPELEKPAQMPIRAIRTPSPKISAVALTSLYLVHGGNDGLVQCWDPLASKMGPIREIHSHNPKQIREENRIGELFPTEVVYHSAAHAICLDPDATVLRGVVAVGHKIRYWSFAGDASSAIGGKRKKKNVRKAGVGGGVKTEAAERLVDKGALENQIVIERGILEAEREETRREQERLRRRFAAGEMSEAELVAYGIMLSQEVFEQEEREKGKVKEKEMMGLEAQDRVKSEWVAAASPASQNAPYWDHRSEENDVVLTYSDPDLAEAIRRSRLEVTQGQNQRSRFYWDNAADENIENGNGNGTATPSSFKSGTTKKEWPSPKGSAMMAKSGSSGADDKEDMDEDFEFALRLSLAEEESRRLMGGGVWRE